MLSLLSDGLPCLSESTAFEGYKGREVELLVKAFAAAVKAVRAVAECHRLAALQQDAAGGGTWAGNGGEGDVVGFSMLLCEALSLVTSAVSVDVVPLVEKGSGDATVRSQHIDILLYCIVFFCRGRGGGGHLRQTVIFCLVFVIHHF